MYGMKVHSINVSNGGVPKLPRNSAWVSARGVEGDRQRNPLVHGGPTRAVALYSLELIQALQREGHPIAPGTIGENVTLEGLDWSRLVPGTRLRAGEVELEITSYSSPCRNIRDSFVDGNFARVSQTLHPGWSRVYALVLQGGRIAVGDHVTVETTV